jgi:hypothetical protein
MAPHRLLPIHTRYLGLTTRWLVSPRSTVQPFEYYKLGLVSLLLWFDRKPQDLGCGSHVYLLPYLVLESLVFSSDPLMLRPLWMERSLLVLTGQHTHPHQSFE